MERFARLAPSKGNAIIEDVRRPKGFFKLLETRFGGARHKGILTPLHRICSLTRGHGVKTVVIEEIGDAIELVEENEDLQRLGRSCRAHRVCRLSFFKAAFSKIDEIAQVPPESFIGYAIWKEDFGASLVPECSRVYEAILPPPPEPYIHVRGIPHRPCLVAGRRFVAVGFPFYQQNSVTNVCAHAAVRTLASCFSDEEMTFRQMNDHLNLTGEDFKKREGLYTPEIEELVKQSGAECIRADYNSTQSGEGLPDEEQPAVQYQRFVYGSIESGFPAIIIFGENGGSENQAANKEFLHAVTAFGHTFNRHMWVPRVEVARFRLGETTGYIPSDLWAGSFVGHDDTLGPHFTIPRHYMRGMRSASHDHPRYKDVTEGVAHVICAQPRFARMRPIDAELIAVGWLWGMLDSYAGALAEEWGHRLLAQRDASQLVLRPLLVQKGEYMDHLSRLRGWDSTEEKLTPDVLARMDADLPVELFWMVEISVQELFPTNCRKLGEVLIDPKFAKEDLTLENFAAPMLAVRLPGVWIGPSSKDGTSTKEPLVTPIITHTCLFGCKEDEDLM